MGSVADGEVLAEKSVEVDAQRIMQADGARADRGNDQLVVVARQLQPATGISPGKVGFAVM